MGTDDEISEVKLDVVQIKLDIKEIKSHCCNMKLIEKSIEARSRTNNKLDNISDKISSLELADTEVSRKIDTLYKVMYLGMGAFIVIEAFILPSVLASLKVGG